ncbi:hypothetical protein CMV_003896 [Castanea mollissima]|uniref:Leucine-rich repeat-containing N-terminal plant-type domain-containing protein n=1 Tax=Castanea mollissima TaxID=60419 RepID=A0A8J4RTS9_9ROSI|nr:hypothetical protein CMV_003896 [Castanea mollissima]
MTLLVVAELKTESPLLMVKKTRWVSVGAAALEIVLTVLLIYYSTRNIQKCENSYPKTGSWKEDKDCCTWDGVVCDNSTRHVIALDLSCSWLYGSIPSNSTLFLLRHLRSLNLAGNDFHSIISPEFGNFQSLTHLNLSHSRFYGEIPYEISQLSSLVSLDLSYNSDPRGPSSYFRSQLTLSIETPVWKRVIGNLTQLRELFLDATDMSSITPNSLMNLSSSLTTLSLGECHLQGTFEINVFRLPCLQTLDLGYNSNLEGSLPKSIGSLKFLEYLNLRSCNFTGAIPTSIGNLTQIIKLDLSENSFSGLLPLSIFDLPNLSVLYLDNNQLVGPLPNHVSGLNLLIDLSLSLNFLNGTLPSWLFSLTSLVTLDLGYNRFIGEIGEFKYNNSLDYLDLSYNMLQGSIPSSISRLVNLSYLSLSSNNLQGSVPSSISRLVNLTYLSLSSNNLQGSIPSSISRLVNLTTLYLSSNNLSIMLDLEMTPFIAKLVGFVAFEIIVSALLSIKCPVTCKVLFWLVVALKNRGKHTLDCLSGIISLLVVLELEFVMIYALVNLLHSCQGVDFKIKLLTIGGKRLKLTIRDTGIIQSY